jgi:hypothetical protein
MPAAGKKTAERFGLIGEIDRWVTRQAIRSPTSSVMSSSRSSTSLAAWA